MQKAELSIKKSSETSSLFSPDIDSYLKHCQAKRMAQIINRRNQNFSVAAIEINAGEWMQFGVHPVETLIQQIWEVKHNEAKLHTASAILLHFPAFFSCWQHD